MSSALNQQENLNPNSNPPSTAPPNTPEMSSTKTDYADFDLWKKIKPLVFPTGDVEIHYHHGTHRVHSFILSGASEFFKASLAERDGGGRGGEGGMGGMMPSGVKYRYWLTLGGYVVVKEPVSYRNAAHETPPPLPTKPPHLRDEVDPVFSNCRGLDNLLRSFYNLPLTLPDMPSCLLLSTMADTYSGLRVVSPTIQARWFTWSRRTLSTRIESNPWAVLCAASKIRCHPVFEEALIHCVGILRSSSLKNSTEAGMEAIDTLSQPTLLSEKIKICIVASASRLQQRINQVNYELLTLGYTHHSHNDHDHERPTVEIVGHDKPFFRDMRLYRQAEAIMREFMAKAFSTSKTEKDLYRSLSKAEILHESLCTTDPAELVRDNNNSSLVENPAYCAAVRLLRLDETPTPERERERENLHQIVAYLERRVRMVVRGLMRNGTGLEDKEAEERVGYLLCADLGEGGYPWGDEMGWFC